METNGGRRRTVLIADADDASVVTARDVLTSVGYRTLTTAQGDEALRIGLKERPAVALLEVELPRMNGFELCRAFRDELGQTIGIALVSATRTTPIDVSSGLLIGADDYIAKPVDPSELVGRVRALRRRITMNGADGSSEGLTGREREILRLLAEGLDQAEIAGTLSVSPRTVGGHIEHVLVKLGVHSRAQAVAAAYRLRLFD